MSGTTNFPASVDSHTGGNPYGFAEAVNGLATTLSAELSSSATTVNVTSNVGFPTRGTLRVGRGAATEVITYTGVSSTTQFTGCTRGAGGTTARAHVANTTVANGPVAANHNDVAAAVAAIENVVIVMPGDPIVINGNMDHFQRATSGVTATTTYNRLTSYAADRIFVLPSGASVTLARSTTVPDFKSRYSLSVTGAVSVTTVDIGQRLRAQVVNTRCLQSLVFSAYVRNESGAAFTPTLRIGTPGSADDFTTVTNRLAVSLQECADSAWTRVYYVFDPTAYTNVANGMEVCLRVPSGSLVSGDVVRVAQFDLRPGIALAAYAPPDPDLELERCLRYYEVLDATAGSDPYGIGQAYSTTGVAFVLQVARKWKKPAVAFSATNHFYFLDAAGGAITSTNMAGFSYSPCAVYIIGAVASGLVAGNASAALAAGASSKIYVDAEL